MSTAGRPKTSIEVLEHTVDAYYTFEKNQTQTAEALGISRSGLQDRLKQASLRGLMGFEPVLPGMVVASTNTTTNQDGDVVRTSVRQVPEPGPKLELLDGFNIAQRSSMTDGDRNIKLQWHIERPEAKSRRELVAAIKSEFDDYRGKAELIDPPDEVDDDLMVVYPVVDPHTGMLSWGKETGVANDLNIGIDRMFDGASRLISAAPPAKYGAIVNTGDFFHADNQRNVTTGHGHQLDVDGRATKVRQAGVGLLRRMVDLGLQKHEFIILKNLKGNHDEESASWLNITLGLFYENNPRVLIDMEDGNNDIWLHQFGRNYIGATHGHNMKPERMAMVMAEDRPDYWAASDNRWFIFGHIHHETVKEVGSVRCESFRQPVPRDSFAHSHGYRSGNSMQSITLHREDGEIGRSKINFPRRFAA